MKYNQQKGYTYTMVIAAVAIMAIMAESATLLVSTQVIRDKEAELIFRGNAYKRAIESYYKAGKTVKTFPKNLDNLLNDPRYLNKHHIRQLYPDPITGNRWQLQLNGTGGITGVYSSSYAEPRKKSNFPVGYEQFEGTLSYSEWVFAYNPEIKKQQVKPISSKQSEDSH
jgi:type II secretory pathway pseudopilin PulG